MKKLSLVPVLAVVALMLSSCGNSASNMQLDNKADSLAYAQGIRISEGFRYNAVNRLDVDSTLVPEMLKGVRDAFYAESEKERAYYVGAQYGTALRDQVLKNILMRMEADGDSAGIDEDLFLNAFISAVNEEELKMDITTAMVFVKKADYERHTQYMSRKFADNKINSAEFLANNANQPGVVVLPSGLQYKVEKMGKGQKPKETDKVKVNYEGTLIDGTVFDSSYKRNEPTTFRLKEVIKGWTEGLQLMPVGSKFRFFIPDSLAYGDREMALIPPYSALVFDIELVGIE